MAVHIVYSSSIRAYHGKNCHTLIIDNTSNKEHFMKNVKECRDVIVKKVLEQGWDTRTTHYTHVGPMTLHIALLLL